jgi:carbamoyltransferase
VKILGINCFSHDTAAALLVDGEPVAFIEEERFDRQKHTKAFPDSAVQYCLQQAGIGIADVDVVVFAHRAGLDYARGAWDAAKRLPLGAKRLAVQTYVDLALWKKQRDFVRRFGYRGRVVNVGHHEAHAAATFFASGFDEAAILTLDRGGDFLSTTLGRGRGNHLETLKVVRNPDSLGQIYTRGHRSVVGQAPEPQSRSASVHHSRRHTGHDDGLPGHLVACAIQGYVRMFELDSPGNCCGDLKHLYATSHHRRLA